MSAQFLKRLVGRLCPHRFSWPHSGLNGQDYQVCLICGTAFGYDWTSMRRTGRLALPPDSHAELLPGKGSVSKS
jgi:hypothetical protein